MPIQYRLFTHSHTQHTHTSVLLFIIYILILFSLFLLYYARVRVCVCVMVDMYMYKGHFKNDANILDIIYGTAKLKMFAELLCACVCMCVCEYTSLKLVKLVKGVNVYMCEYVRQRGGSVYDRPKWVYIEDKRESMGRVCVFLCADIRAGETSEAWKRQKSNWKSMCMSVCRLIFFLIYGISQSKQASKPVS